MSATSREAVPPRCEHEIQAKKTNIVVFFTSTRLLILDALPHGHTFTQDYLITEVLPMLLEENVRFRRRHSVDIFPSDGQFAMSQSQENHCRN
jgi:hypothetical protein